MEKSRFHIGMRNVKTGLVVFLCLVIYLFVGRDGYFLACTSGIICMQDSLEKSMHSGLNRLIGTGFGALLGISLLYLNLLITAFDITLLSATLGTMLLIFFCNVIRKPDSVIIGCVVLLAIVLQQTAESPLIYGINRLIDTFVGIFVAVIVNRAIRPPKPEDEPDDPPHPLPETALPAEDIPAEQPKSEEGTV